VLLDNGIEYFDALPGYDESSRLLASLKGIRGQNSGISAGYFWMLAGSDDLIKPDRMILAFIADTLRRGVRVPEARQLLAEVSGLLRSALPHLTPRLLDYEVWRYQREQGRAAAAQGARSHQERVGILRRSDARAQGGSPRPERHHEGMLHAQTSPIEDALDQAGRELQGEFGPAPIPVARLRERTVELSRCKRQ